MKIQDVVKTLELSRCHVTADPNDTWVFLWKGKGETKECLLAARTDSIGKDPNSTRALIFLPGDPDQFGVKKAPTDFGSAKAKFHVSLTKWNSEYVASVLYAVLSWNLEETKPKHGEGWLTARTTEFQPMVRSTKSKAMDQFVERLQSSFMYSMDASYRAAVSSLKEYFSKYHDRMSEEDIIAWFRESTVKTILDS